MTAQTTRRALIGGAGLAAAAAIVPAIATASTAASRDASLLAHWDRRQRCYAQMLAKGSYFTAETHSSALSTEHDAQEPPIVDATAHTARGALAQAWLAWDAQGQVRNDDDRVRFALIHAADFDALADMERRKELDWDDSTMLAVIRSLRSLAGEV